MKEFDDFDMDRETEDSGIDINLSEIFSLFWKKRLKIVKIAACFFLFGIFLAFALPSEYKSTCVFVPQFNQSLMSKYSSLASMMGVEMDLSSTSDAQVSPKVYPLILNHPGLQLELMHTKFHFEKADEPIDLYDYYTDKKYQKFNLIGFIMKYTVGLPGLAINAIKGSEDDEIQLPVSDGSGTDLGADDENSITAALRSVEIYRMTKKEFNVAKAMLRNLDLDVDAKKGYLTLTATMPEPVASAEFCEAAYLALKKYVGDFKRRKSQTNLAYIDAQVAEAYDKYVATQEACAKVMDSNLGNLTASAKMERIRKEGDYKLASQMYSELSRQQVSARIKLEESTVAFTELAPAEIPVKRSSPKRMATVIGWTFLGLIAACGWELWSEKRRKNSEPEQVESV